MRTFCEIPCLRGAGAVTILVMLAGAAHPAVTISNGATQNMRCANGVCRPTAVDAVLNTGDVETLLASGNVRVTTTGTDVEADDIEVSDAFGWKTGTRLTLDPHRAVDVDAAIAVEGNGGLAVATGTYGTLSFGRKGHVDFADSAGVLSIRGRGYTRVHSIRELAKAVAANPDGDYALANDYDAGKDGTYSKAPVHTPLHGQFDGMGHTISNLSIAAAGGAIGLFADNVEGQIRNITLKDANVTSTKGTVGTLVGINAGGLSGSHATGSVTVLGSGTVGGLVGGNTNRGGMSDDDADVAVVRGKKGTSGGLAGSNDGPISECYAVGAVKDAGEAGGLVGWNAGQIENAYNRGSVSGRDSGGLIGYNSVALGIGYAYSSYSTGAIKAKDYAGGLIGYDSRSGESRYVYWDTTTSGITNRSQGAGYPANDPGLKARTTKRLQSGLPKGFDPGVWAQNANINDGFPYLISDPPQ